MLKLLQKLRSLWPFGGHGALDKEAPAVSQPHAPGLSVEDERLLAKIQKNTAYGRTSRIPDSAMAFPETPRVPPDFFKSERERALSAIRSNGPFPAAIIQAAIDTAEQGILIGDIYIWPSVTLAQWALESAYGTRMPRGSNNPFGIKAIGHQPTVNAVTWEVEHGKKREMSQPFRKFNSQTEAFAAHNRLLATSKHYKKARAAETPVGFAKALTGVYATDPDYDKKLRDIMGRYNLFQYDRK